ncbi:MAG: glycosyl transferase [Caulobacterales bacterium 32-69-10]|nr:MAG: glycosyl transferase [Caulobacterales bacterium 32-69-10]
MNALNRPDGDGPPLRPPLQGVEVSVVMVVYRTGPALAESLRRVLAGDEVGEFVLVDNGSATDEAAVMTAVEADARVTVLRGHGNVGFARGANLGAAAAHGRVLVFLNPDAFLEDGCIAALKAALDPARSPCLVGARMMNTDGTEQRGGRRGEVTPASALLSLTKLAGRLPGLKRFEIHHQDEAVPSGPVATPTVSGACFAMTRTDFTALGGFDEGYFLHVEDIDLCWRVRRAGGTVLFQPQARVLHLGSTARRAPLLIELNKGFGLARFFRKRADTAGQKVAALVLTPVILAVSVARAGLRRRPARD